MTNTANKPTNLFDLASSLWDMFASFVEEDESPEDVQTAFDQAVKGTTGAPPAPVLSDEERRAWAIEMAIGVLTQSEHTHDSPTSVVDLAQDYEFWVRTGNERPQSDGE